MNPIWWVLLVFDLKSIQQRWGHQTLKLKKKNNLENFQVNLAFQLNQALIWTNPESHAGIDVSFQFILVYSNGNPIAISFLSPFFEG